MIQNLKKALALHTDRQRRSLIVLLLFMLVMAIMETLGIGLLMPYIAVVNSPDLIVNSHYLGAIYRAFEFDSPQRFIIVSSIALIALFIVKNIIFVIQQYVQSRQLLRLQLDVESRLMRSYLEREYLFFTEKNPAELYQNVRNVSGIISLILTPAMTIATEMIVLVLISAFLLFVQPWVTLVVVVVSGVLGFVIYRYTRKKATRYGEEGNKFLIEMNKWMYQAFGGIKEVKILSKEDFFLDRSMSYSEKSAWVGMKATMLSSVTRPVIESVWFSLTVMLVLVSILLGNSGAAMLPIIVLLAAAAIRIMPALNRILNATISIRQATYHINAVCTELDRKSEGVGLEANDASPNEISFTTDIQFDHLAFSYPGHDTPVLHDLSLRIERGKSIAFVGSSGAGKTTAVDLLLGLLEPGRGQILVDGTPLSHGVARSWRRNFGYVPQTIYLSDDSIRNNIAFGQLPHEIDEARVNAVIEQAQLSSLVARLPDGLDTIVGDRGARLSGGQRQRIGIARALYRNPPILVLDEATSALDNETEREITEAIRALSGDKTVILIAHRLSTIAHCDKIVFLVDGAVKASGTYQELLRDCELFYRFVNTTSSQGEQQ
ncbi:ABC transporter ATP-binding protein [Herbaspirillum sp. NPDC087042]|uniref:ABC transporter ATP-binding protein n=1 Tax=Herbaspirillum sp. NPDC087042 TaxID=3364004 RepID=UPI003823E6D4